MVLLFTVLDSNSHLALLQPTYATIIHRIIVIHTIEKAFCVVLNTVCTDDIDFKEKAVTQVNTLNSTAASDLISI